MGQDFGKTNWSSYPKWPKVTLANGGSGYVVPNPDGSPSGWVYDPFTSQETGRPQLFPDPTVAQKEKDKQNKAIKDASSPAKQAIPVVTAVGAGLGGKLLYDHLSGPTAGAPVIAKNGNVILPSSDGTIKIFGPNGQEIAGGAGTVTPQGSLPVQAAPNGAVIQPAVVTPTTPSEAFVQGATPTQVAPMESAGTAVQSPITFTPSAAPIQIGTNIDGSPIYQTLSPSDVATTAPVEAPSSTYGSYLQGAAGAAQLYGGYNQFKGGDKFGGGLTMAAGGANLGAAAGFQSVAPWAAPLTAAAGLYGTYGAIQQGNATNSAMQGAQAGAGIGTMILPGFGTAIGAGVGLVAGAALGHIKTAKSGSQQQRDKIRDVYQATNIADDQYNVTLADGSVYNIGMDGHTKLENFDSTKSPDGTPRTKDQPGLKGGKAYRNTWDVDLSNPLALAAIPRIKDFAIQMAGEGASQKVIDQTTGMLVNAVTSNATTQEQVDANITAVLSRVPPQQGAETPRVGTPPQLNPPTSTDPKIGNQGPELKETKTPVIKPSGSPYHITSMQDANRLGRSLAKRINQRVG